MLRSTVALKNIRDNSEEQIWIQLRKTEQEWKADIRQQTVEMKDAGNLNNSHHVTQLRTAMFYRPSCQA